MNKFLDCVEDGLILSPGKDQANEKLFYLRRYLEMFVIATKNGKWRSVNYIDLFSGAGKINLSDSNKIIIGSPLIAVTLEKPFDKYFFVEANTRRFNALQKRCFSSHLNASISFFHGDANHEVIKIIDEINKLDNSAISGKSSSLNFAFIDPFGLELKWSTVESLSRVKRMDLLIYYPQMGLEREMPNECDTLNCNKIDGFFGTDQWRDIYKKHRKEEIPSLHRALMDLIWDKLVSLDYLANKQTEPLMTSKSKNAPLYRLMLASKNPLATKLWKEAIKKDDNGQIRFNF